MRQRKFFKHLIRWCFFYLGVFFIWFEVMRVVPVPSMSMFPYLRSGSWLLLNEWSYGFGSSYHHQKRGDVIVFRVSDQSSLHYVKRIIGLPGDTIQLRSGRVLVNGQIVDQDHCRNVFLTRNHSVSPVSVCDEHLGERVYPIVSWKNFVGPFDTTIMYHVPQDSVFVLGDNRDDSADSRVSYDLGGVEMVPIKQITGSVFSVLYGGQGGLSFSSL